MRGLHECLLSAVPRCSLIAHVQQRVLDDAAHGQVVAYGEDAHSFDGSSEQLAEVLMVAGEKMTTVRMNGG